MKATLICILILVGCTEVNQNVSPTSVIVTIGDGVTAEAGSSPTASVNSVRLDPERLSLRIGDGAVVKVEVFDENGQEISAANRGTISYSFDDPPGSPPVATVSKVDGRWLTFLGLNAGTVNVTISVAGATGILPVQVSP